MTYIIKINTVDLSGYLKAPGGYTVQRPKLYSNAGRNLAGDLKTTFIGIFPKITLDFKSLTEAQMDTVVTLLDNASFTVQWWDVVSQGYKTGTFYASDFDYSLYTKYHGFYEPFKVNLIAFNKLS